MKNVNNLKQVEVSMAKRSWMQAISRLRSIEQDALSIKYHMINFPDEYLNGQWKIIKRKRKEVNDLIRYWKAKYKFYQRKINIKDEF